MKSMIDIIVLAAGESIRMGAKNKLTLPLNGKTIIEHVFNEVASANFNKRIVVTGSEQEEITALIDTDCFETVFNPNYKLGMTSSIQQGVMALGNESKAVMILPSDLPFISSQELNLLIDNHINSCKSAINSITVAAHEGIRKGPTIFSCHYYAQILSHQNPKGCKQILNLCPQEVSEVAISNSSFFNDIDTPEDYKELLK